MEPSAATTAPASPGRILDPTYADVRSAPPDRAVVVALVLRPARNERLPVNEARLDVAEGMVGDDWRARGSKSMPGGLANPEAQLTLMSTRVLAAIADDPDRWPLAGDQVLVDMDLSEANLPVGTRLLLGNAEVEVTALPHTGCAQFAARFGHDALRWISTHEGRALRMRGMYVRIVSGGTVSVGDVVRKA
jgi:MOSC domain-containing protein YiiM